MIFQKVHLLQKAHALEYCKSTAKSVIQWEIKGAWLWQNWAEKRMRRVKSVGHLGQYGNTTWMSQLAAGNVQSIGCKLQNSTDIVLQHWYKENKH